MSSSSELKRRQIETLEVSPKDVCKCGATMRKHSGEFDKERVVMCPMCFAVESRGESNRHRN